MAADAQQGALDTRARPPHQDREFVGFKPSHFHADYRFLPADLRRTPAVSPGIHPVYQWPIHGIKPESHGAVDLAELSRSDIPTESWYQPRKLRFKEHHPSFPHRHAGWLDKLHQAYQGSTLQGEALICPHRGASLAGISSDPDGFLTCPLHGLRFCPEGGQVLAEWRIGLEDTGNGESA